MSYFTVAVNDVLDRMKNTSGTTRQQFALRTGMSLSTLSSYTTGRSVPNASALESIIAGLDESDAHRVIVSHLMDETPAQWQQRLAVSIPADGRTSETLPLADFSFLPPAFVRQVEAILVEAKRNEHIIGFIDELSALLNLTEERTAEPWPSADEIPRQKVPVSAASTTDRSGFSTRVLNEEAPKAGKKTSGPRAASSRPGIAAVVKQAKGKKP